VTAAASSDCLFCGLVLVPASFGRGGLHQTGRQVRRRGRTRGDEGWRGGEQGAANARWTAGGTRNTKYSKRVKDHDADERGLRLSYLSVNTEQLLSCNRSVTAEA
jgi:hypothetical protein